MPSAGIWVERVCDLWSNAGNVTQRVVPFPPHGNLVDLVSRASVQFIDLLLQPSDVILDTTPNFRGSPAEAVLLGGEHGRHLSSGIVDADGLSKVQYEYQWPLPSGLYRIAPKRAVGVA